MKENKGEKESPVKGYLLVVSDNCPHCSEARELLKDDIEAGNVDEVNLEDINQEALDLLTMDLEVRSVPSLLLVTKNEENVGLCNVEKQICTLLEDKELPG